ncbi:MAG TPA: NADH-quinone oxidoreductase subunit M [Vicinamibacterales bacterium]|jgi:NADH-quinone oxidoreductase subunit M|nr:NADH-quinone oxidoreductase subunit M [Vicinamibacterales bacterium]
MTLVWLVVVPFVAGAAAWVADRWSHAWPRWIALAGIGIDLAIAVTLWFGTSGAALVPGAGPWLAEIDVRWIDALGIHLHFAIDGLSLLLVLLTGLLGVLAVAASWTEIQDRVGAFHFQLLWILSGLIGVFTAMDLFLFYFFWEMMLVPMFFLIGIWGHERRIYAATKFFLFTQVSGLLMLIAIVALYIVHGRATGTYTFDVTALAGTPMSSTMSWWLMLGFFGAFAVKLPMVPLHTWLPDAHTEAPTAGSVVLASLLLKTGAYGMLRFVLPLFRDAAASFAPVAIVLGVIGVVYGAALAFGQTDLKRLVAYTSVSHMGFVLIGIFAGTTIALQGAILQILCHGLSTGALFILAGAMQERLHTREMGRMGGLWADAPRMGGMTLFFALASMGLPGLGNFIAEFLVLAGTYRVSPIATIVASTGLIVSTVYALWLVQAAFQGPRHGTARLRDLGVREMATMAVLVAALVWIGLYPQSVVDTASPAIARITSAPRVASRAP